MPNIMETPTPKKNLLGLSRVLSQEKDKHPIKGEKGEVIVNEVNLEKEEEHKRSIAETSILLRKVESAVIATKDALSSDEISSNKNVKEILDFIDTTSGVRERLVKKGKTISREEVGDLVKFYVKVDKLVDKKLRADVNGRTLDTILSDFTKDKRRDTLAKQNTQKLIERNSKKISQSTLEFLKSNIERISSSGLGEESISSALSLISPELAMADKLLEQVGLGSKDLLRSVTSSMESRDDDIKDSNKEVVDAIDESVEQSSQDTEKVVQSLQTMDLETGKRQTKDTRKIVKSISLLGSQDKQGTEANVVHQESSEELQEEQHKEVIDELKEITDEVGDIETGGRRMSGFKKILKTLVAPISAVLGGLATKFGLLVRFFSGGGFVKLLLSGLKFLIKNPIAALGTYLIGSGAKSLSERDDEQGFIRNEQGELDVFDSKLGDYGAQVAGGAALGGAVGSVVPVVGTAIGAAIGAALGLGQALVVDYWDDIKPILKSGLDFVMGSIMEGINFVYDMVLGIPKLFSKILDGVEYVKTGINSVIIGFVDAFSEIDDIFLSFINRIWGVISSPVDYVKGLIFGSDTSDDEVESSLGLRNTLKGDRVEDETSPKATILSETNLLGTLVNLLGGVVSQEKPPSVQYDTGGEYDNFTLPDVGDTESIINNSYDNKNIDDSSKVSNVTTNNYGRRNEIPTSPYPQGRPLDDVGLNALNTGSL